MNHATKVPDTFVSPDNFEDWDESYDYDANGNRVGATNSGGTFSYVIGDFNRLLKDGTYTYLYDYEGNLTSKFTDSDIDGIWDSDESGELFTYDHRNRLTNVSFINTSEEITESIDYAYDAFNQLIHRSIDPDGALGSDAIGQTVFIYDNGQVVLQFDKSGSGDVTDSDLSHRYLWNLAAVDQLFTDEQVTSLESEGDTYWATTDNLNSVKHMLDSTGRSRLDLFYDGFGRLRLERHHDSSGEEITSEDPEYIDEAFQYTGRWFDRATGLQNNLNRWYDSSIGRWMSEDPIGFNGDPSNLYRYVGNEPLDNVDALGLNAWALPIWWGNLEAGAISAGELAEGLLWGRLFLYKRWTEADEAALKSHGTEVGHIVTWLNEKRFTEEQDKVIQEAKLAKQKGRTKPLSEAEANDLLSRGRKAGLKNCRGPEKHPDTEVDFDHIHIGPINHIPVVPPIGI